jgi:hypothetical protein
MLAREPLGGDKGRREVPVAVVESPTAMKKEEVWPPSPGETGG